MKIRYCFILFLLTGLTQQSLYSQCCGAGSPVAGDADQKGMRKKSWKIFGFYKHSFSDTYYKGSEKIKLPDAAGVIKTSNYNYVELNAIYGITNRLSVHGNTGYYTNKSVNYGNNIIGVQSGSGLSDASLILKYTVYNKPSKKFDITPALGMKFPVGVFDQQKNGILLPISVQPSSGSYKYIGNLIIFKGIMKGKIGLLSFNSVEVATNIYSEYFKNFKYGNLYLNALYITYFFKGKYAAIFQIRNECRAKETESGVKNDYSGGDVLIFSPAFNYKFFTSFNATATFEMPVYRNYNGVQMGNKFCFSLRISKDFGMCK